MTKDRLSWIISGLDFNTLSDWEEKFVINVEKYFKTHGDLTEAQEDKLEEIFRDKTK